MRVSLCVFAVALTTLLPLSAAQPLSNFIKIDVAGGGMDDLGFLADEPNFHAASDGVTRESVYDGDLPDLRWAPVYASQRSAENGSLVYRLPVPDGVYSVGLMFTEHSSFEGTAAVGSRVMDLFINNVALDKGIDVFEAAGGLHKAYYLQKLDIPSLNNRIEILLARVTGTPMLSGIVIEGPDAAGLIWKSTPPPQPSSAGTEDLPKGSSFQVLNQVFQSILQGRPATETTGMTAALASTAPEFTTEASNAPLPVGPDPPSTEDADLPPSTNTDLPPTEEGDLASAPTPAAGPAPTVSLSPTEPALASSPSVFPAPTGASEPIVIPTPTVAPAPTVTPELTETSAPTVTPAPDASPTASPDNGVSLSGEGKWHNEVYSSGKPVARHEACAVMADGLVYSIGGRGKKPVSVYDPKTGAWSTRPGPTVELNHMQCVHLGKRIYIGGGWYGKFPFEKEHSVTWAYDIPSNRWVQLRGLREDRRRGGGAFVAYGGKLYLSHGAQGGHGSHATTTGLLDVYDPSTDEWTALPSAPTPRDHTGGAVVDGRLCVAGGRDGGTADFWNANVAAVDCFDFGKRAWEKRAQLPLPRGGAMVAATCQGLLMVAGGEGKTSSNQRGQAFDRVDLLNVGEKRWLHPTFMTSRRHGSGLAVASCACGNIYVPSGSAGLGGGPEVATTDTWSPDGVVRRCS